MKYYLLLALIVFTVNVFLAGAWTAHEEWVRAILHGVFSLLTLGVLLANVQHKAVKA